MPSIARQSALLLLLTVSACLHGWTQAQKPHVYVPIEGNFKVLTLKNGKQQIPDGGAPLKTNIAYGLQDSDQFSSWNRQYRPYMRPYYMQRNKKPKDNKDKDKDKGKGKGGGYTSMTEFFDDYGIGKGYKQQETLYRVVKVKKRRPYRPKPKPYKPKPLYSNPRPYDSYSPHHSSYGNSYNYKPKSYHKPHNSYHKPQSYGYNPHSQYDHHHSPEQYHRPDSYQSYGHEQSHYGKGHNGHDHKHHSKHKPHHDDHHKHEHHHDDHHKHEHHHDDHHKHEHHHDDHHKHEHHHDDHHKDEHHHDDHHKHKHHHKSADKGLSSIFKDSTHLHLGHGVHHKSPVKHHSSPDVISSASFRHPPPLHKGVRNSDVYGGFQMVKPETVHYSHEHSFETASHSFTDPLTKSFQSLEHSDKKKSKSFDEMTNEEKLVEFLRQNKIEVQTSPPVPNVISPQDVLQSSAFKVNLPLEDESTEVSFVTPYATTTTPKPLPEPKLLPKPTPTPKPFTSVVQPDYSNFGWVPSVPFFGFQTSGSVAQPCTEKTHTAHTTTIAPAAQAVYQPPEDLQSFVSQLFSSYEISSEFPVSFRQSTKTDRRPPRRVPNTASKNKQTFRHSAGSSRSPSKQTRSRFRSLSSRLKNKNTESRKKGQDNSSKHQSLLYLNLRNMPDQASWSVEEPYLQELEPLDDVKVLGGVKFEDSSDDGFPIDIEDLRKIIDAFSRSRSEESDHKNWNEWISEYHPELIPYLTMKSFIEQSPSFTDSLISKPSTQQSTRRPSSIDKLVSSSLLRDVARLPDHSLKFPRQSVTPQREQPVRSPSSLSQLMNSVLPALTNHRAQSLPSRPSSSSNWQPSLPREPSKPFHQEQPVKPSSESDVVKIFGEDSVLGALEVVMEAVEKTDSGEKLYLVRSSNQKDEPRRARENYSSAISPPPKRQASYTPPPPKRQASYTPPPPKRQASYTPPLPKRQASYTPPPPKRQSSLTLEPAIPLELKNLGTDNDPLISFTPFFF